MLQSSSFLTSRFHTLEVTQSADIDPVSGARREARMKVKTCVRGRKGGGAGYRHRRGETRHTSSPAGETSSRSSNKSGQQRYTRKDFLQHKSSDLELLGAVDLLQEQGKKQFKCRKLANISHRRISEDAANTIPSTS